MEYDLIYPESLGQMIDTPCIVAAVYFNEHELISLGVPKDSLEVQEPFWDYNEFQKPFELWASPKFLSDYYDRYKSLLQQEYWREITEDEFLTDVFIASSSIPILRSFSVSSSKYFFASSSCRSLSTASSFVTNLPLVRSE